MSYTVNLTQKQKLTHEQIMAYAIPLNEYRGSGLQPSDLVKNLLTFNSPPTAQEIVKRAQEIAEIAAEAVRIHRDEDEKDQIEAALIDGPDFMLPALAKELRSQGIKPVCSFFGQELRGGPTKSLGFVEV